MEQTTDNTQHPQYLTFLVAGDEYAVGILRVREIIQYPTVTRVPRTPAWVRGAINLRGTVVPVVDLAVKFGLPPSDLGRSACIVLAEVKVDDEPVVMGMIADAVRQVVDLPAASVQPPPRFGTRVKLDYLQGMGRVDERMVLLLDMDRVLSADELVAATATTTVAVDEGDAAATDAETAQSEAPALS
jgi:purine-binding chemotaxis protein CheW